MNQTAYSMSPGDLAGELHKSFIEGVSWPIDQASLAALFDIGLTVQQIAHYFSVTPADVLRLANSIGAVRCGSLR